jgi:hypothetical protein
MSDEIVSESTEESVLEEVAPEEEASVEEVPAEATA